ncbi:sensor domain-containing protein [Halarsenatibacter silvermanii]|uniref:PAS domain S-box-containing protein n=1 Tax=Halarsenatibacter silvermanii TaxID=321763 RepID=A0A1G9R623_9FIRM|nr:EAL domain-containing protein [Halarsenatibacter silvermanii]SDM18287.1 PAS domain S-box-containing protein [Halarsenatibacter silvermanii]
MSRLGKSSEEKIKKENINLLISNDRNRELLKELLSDKFEVFVQEETNFNKFNLIFLDEKYFKRYKEQIKSYKQDNRTFTPMIYLQDKGKDTSQNLFKLVEDVIELPVSQKLLLARVDNLIRNKRLWTEWNILKERYENIFNNINDMIFLVDIIEKEEPGFKIVEVNKKLLEELKYDKEALKNSSLEKFMPEEDVNELFKFLKDQGEALLTTKFYPEEGEAIPVEINARKLNIQGKEQILCAARDMTEKRKREELEEVSFYDPNSGLPNSSSLIKNMDKLIEEEKTEDIYLLVIDIKNYEEIMNSIGHTRWGGFLKEIATQLKERLELKFILNEREAANSDMEISVYNIYHDKLGFLLVNTSEDRLTDFIEELKDKTELSFYYNSIPIFLNSHLGVAPYQKGDKAVELFQRAYQAMNSAVSDKKRIKIYEEALETETQENFMILGDVRNALDEDQFELHYMPKVRLKTGEITGVEALIRWPHPERGNISPGEFIPPVERTGLINELTHWVLNRAAEKKRILADRGIDINMAVNISPRNLKQKGFVEDVKNIIAQNGLKPAQFELELTETEIMEDVIGGNNSLGQLLKEDIKISMDDFGTGYSSLAYLKNLDINTLKIDLSFVQVMNEDKKSYEIVKTAIRLGQVLGKEIVAEGIESQDVMGDLKELGCDYGQGYYIGKPMPREDFVDFYGSWQEQIF